MAQSLLTVLLDLRGIRLEIVGYILLLVAVVGTLSSTVYLGLVLAAVAKFRAESRESLQSPVADADLPDRKSVV